MILNNKEIRHTYVNEVDELKRRYELDKEEHNESFEIDDLFPLPIEDGGTGVTSLDELKRILGIPSILDCYPIGSIYINASDPTPPSELFGGEWEQIKDVFLLSAGDTYAAGDTGGEATHTLTVNEMPKHSHSIQYAETDGHYSGSKTEARPWGGDYSTTVGSTGGGLAHNNMPPYLTVYAWKRIK